MKRGFLGEFSTGATAVMWLVATPAPLASSNISSTLSPAFVREDVSMTRLVDESPSSQMIVSSLLVPSG